MKNKTVRNLPFVLLLALIVSCHSVEKRENLATISQPKALRQESAYIFLSHYTVTEVWPGKLIVRRILGGPKVYLPFANSHTLNYALYELEPGEYKAIGFSAGNDPMGDSMGIPVTAAYNQKWNICAGCVLYVGRVRLDFSKEAFSEVTEYDVVDASAEDLKKMSEYLAVSKQTKIINGAIK
jgi:hypothetical protein